MYFGIWRSEQNKQWYFNIKGANHEKIAQSEGYTTREAALHAIGVIKKGAATAGIYDYDAKAWL